MMAATEKKPIVIRTLMGAGNLELSLKCLGSIRKFCRHGLETGTGILPVGPTGVPPVGSDAHLNPTISGQDARWPHGRAARATTARPLHLHRSDLVFHVHEDGTL